VLNRVVFHQDGAIPRDARMNFVFLNHLNHFGERNFYIDLVSGLHVCHNILGEFELWVRIRLGGHPIFILYFDKSIISSYHTQSLTVIAPAGGNFLHRQRLSQSLR
jgi:hypothetical protein